MQAQTVHYGRYFDLFFTNAVKSISDYHAIGINAKLLPFGADTELHRPVEDVQKHADIVVVGGARPDREQMVKRLRDEGVSVLCYGPGWPPQCVNGKVCHARTVHGEEHVRAINSGRIYYSFARTCAGHLNVKVGLFDAAACGAVVLVDEFPELHRYFDVGKEVIGVCSEQDAVDKAQKLLQTPAMMREIGSAARSRVLRQHRWEHRWNDVLAEIRQMSR
jgi:spore maturation protein CgeB